MQRHEREGSSSSSDTESTDSLMASAHPMFPISAAASPDSSFPQFTKLSPEIRHRIWGHVCPELEVPARILTFCVGEHDAGGADGRHFVLWDGPDLLSQTREVRKLLAIHRETRALVKETLPESVDFKHRVRGDNRITDGRVYFRKEADIIWLDLEPRLGQFHFPPHLNTFRLCDGVKEAVHVGFHLEDGRPTLFHPMTQALTVHLLEQFPRLQYFYYGIPYEILEEFDKAHYMFWCLTHTQCHEYAFTYSPTTNNSGGICDVVWRWPRPDSIQDGLIPRVISKTAKPLETPAARLGWQCIPVFVFEDEYTYSELIEDAKDAYAASDVPELPEASTMSDDEGLLDQEDDGIMSLHGGHHPLCQMSRKPAICGSRPDPLPNELRDWGVQDQEKGYADSDAGDPEDDSSARTFHKFNELPTELRYRIWELFCPDLTAPARLYEFDICSQQLSPTPRDVKVYPGMTTASVTRKIRKVLAVNQESRNLVLRALPDTLDFHILPHEEMMLRGEESREPPSSLRFRKDTDIVYLKEPPEWHWPEGMTPVERAYSLQGFGDIVQNLAVMQPPDFILRDDHLNDIKHLVEQFPKLVNYYYVVPPDLSSPRYMTWAIAPQATRYQCTMVPQGELSHLAIDKALWCWVTKDAAPQLKIPHRVEDMACRLRTLENKTFDVLPMTVFSGFGNFDAYVGAVEEEENARLRAERGEPEEPDSDEDGKYDDEEIPLETLLNAIADGTIPGGIPAVAALLQQAGIEVDTGDGTVFQHGVDDDWEDDDSAYSASEGHELGDADDEMYGYYSF